MELDYHDIEAYISIAQQQRSDAIGQMIHDAWRISKQSLANLVSKARAHGEVTKHAASIG